jgi:septum formation protein
LSFFSAPEHDDMPPLVLASTSRYRQELLGRLGIPFQAVAPGVDEDAIKRTSLSPQQIAETLAERKAAAVAAQHPDAVVIGSDQLVALDGQVLGKAGTATRAVEQLRAMRNRTHELMTAVCVIHPTSTLRHTAVARLTMRALDDDALIRYVAVDNPVDCAGSYKLECRGIALFSGIECDDHSAIIGLPLIWLSGVLAQLGYPVP